MSGGDRKGTPLRGSVTSHPTQRGETEENTEA